MQLAKEDKLLLYLHLFIEAAFLGQVAHPLQADPLEGPPEKPDLSRVRNRDPHHHADRTGLPRPIRSQQPEHLPRIDGQAQVTDSNFALVSLGHSREFDNWHENSAAPLEALLLSPFNRVPSLETGSARLQPARR